MANEVYVATRRQLRGIAESLIAGPQYRATGTIRLAVRPAGFIGTTLTVEVQGTELVWPEGRAALAGPLSALAAATGLTAGPPDGAYDITDPLPTDTDLLIDAGAANDIYRSLYAGGQALVDFAPTEHPVLWPEHFDVAVTLDEVNYGVSPGDSYFDRPYAYVSPWSARTGDFWNAPFGAARALDLGLPESELAAGIVDFFTHGRGRLG
ncbi:MAG: hypothetical protein ABWZ30_09430 [Jiangellaceae bacterium]